MLVNNARMPAHVLAFGALALLLLLAALARRPSDPNGPTIASELEFLPPGVDLSSEPEERKQADEYFDASKSAQGDSSVSLSVANATALNWPYKGGDYAPLDKGTVARAIFNAQGKRLIDKDKDHDYAPSPPDSVRLSRGVHIITSFFRGSYENRRFSEILATLAANLENPHVELVHTLWEKENPAQYFSQYPKLLAKLVTSEVKRQPTYANLFSYANTALLRGSVAIITNADIYFDSSLLCLKGPNKDDNRTTERRVMALSRRHTYLCGLNKADHGSHLDLCREYVHSHDAFIFAPPVPNQIITRTAHPQNRYGAENIVIWEFLSAGFRVLNPCQKLRAYHLHCSTERHYQTRFIDGSNGGTGTYRHGTVWPGTIRYTHQRQGWKPLKKLECGEVLF